MKSLPSVRGALAALFVLGISNAKAQKLDDWEAGKTLSGDTVDFKKLKGRVIAIEYWGTR